MGKVNQRWRRNKLVCIVCILILCHCICGAAFAKTPDEKRLADAIVDIQANPESAVAYNNLGVAYRRLGRFDEAVAAYKKALALDPSLGAIHRNLGVALMKTGVWSEAREAFSRALQIEPTHATTHVNLGVVCINMGLFDDAVNVLKQALAIDAELKDARTHLDHAMKMAEKVSLSASPSSQPAEPEAVKSASSEEGASSSDAHEMSSLLARSWGKLSETLEQVLPLWEQHEELPDSRILGADKASNRKKMNDLLHEAISLLLCSEANEARERMLSLQASIPAVRADIENLKIRKISAPEKTSWPWEESKEDIEEKIQELRGSLENSQKEIDRLRSEVAGYLRSYGLAIDDEHLDVLLSSVLGDDILKNAIVFENVKAVTSKLSELTRESGEELYLAKRYYGMYVVLVEALLFLQDQFVECIDTIYLPRLQIVRENSRNMSQKIEESLRKNDFNASQRRMMKANQDALSLNIMASEKYAQLLQRQKESVLNCRQRLEKDLRVASATYETVQLSGELSDVIRSSLGLFDTLIALQVPEIQLFENMEVKKQFQEITLSLKRSGS